MLQWLETCDSTSHVLKEKIKHGFSVPQALAAGVQTAGVGRLGRTWQSENGNIHLSIALPPGYVDQGLIPRLPMISGILVAEWLEKYFSRVICLKWPNDLIADGKKIGGILCEASYSGSDFKGVVIGIGINVSSAPMLDEETSYRAGYLASQSFRPVPAKELAGSLVEFFLAQLPHVKSQNLSGRWTRLAIKSEHLWIKSNGSSDKGLGSLSAEFPVWRDLGIDESGGLRLRLVDKSKLNGQVTVVNSVSNEHQWALSAQGRALVADIGNSATKLAVISNKDSLTIDATVTGDQAITDLLKSGAVSQLVPVIHCVSVNPDGYASLKKLAGQYNIAVREVHKDPVRLLNSSYDLVAIGGDRFAALEAVYYLQRHAAKPWPLMLVSLGTATTVDHIDNRGHHLGGYIVAGMNTALEALLARGRLLPKSIKLFDDKTVSGPMSNWPTNSNAAIAEGCLASTLGFLQSERTRLARHCNMSEGDVPVLLTGGFAEKLLPLWPDKGVVANPSLTLLGAAVLAFNGR
jgi:biotin-[acetyl-CoA-carboxylase] ligase BirA-like protein